MPSFPNFIKLRQNTNIQASNSCSKRKMESKSGGVGVFVKKLVQLLNEHVLSSSTKDCVTYYQLRVIQWVTGFCRTIREETYSNERTYATLHDCIDGCCKWFHWVQQRPVRVLPYRMEQGEIQDYSQMEQIDIVKRANAQKHIQNGFSRNFGNGKKSDNLYFLKSKFVQLLLKIHETTGVLHRHVSSTCFAAGKIFQHSDMA